VDVHGNAATIVADGNGLIGMDGHPDILAIACQRLVDGVVDHLEDHVMQAGAIVGIADVHTGALANRIQSLEDLDGGAVVIGGSCVVIHAHVMPG